jgi:hypothetical protein
VDDRVRRHLPDDVNFVEKQGSFNGLRNGARRSDDVREWSAERKWCPGAACN